MKETQLYTQISNWNGGGISTGATEAEIVNSTFGILI